MSKEIKTTKKEIKLVEDFDLIFDFYKLVSRQGPGSIEITKRALDFIPGTSVNSKIADIGCGTGGQTITLAKNTLGHITAIDLSEKFIEILDKNVKQAGFEDRFTTLAGSMENLPFSDNELDLIWAEGSIYHLGFERGLREWRQYIREEGYIAVSEVSWITKERPLEIDEFWEQNYNGIDTIPNKIAVMQEAGYIPVSHFVLPVNCWLENFYDLVEAAVDPFLEEQNDSEEAKQFIDSQLTEINLYKKYKDYYSYVFYIGQKI
ncbi:class I SAM-dependent methyltransferase [Dysgonomonas termitidis]|uniref:Class I SAM-dependent methyltransferase n=1 Tax=Dysgonomonas termitidis TaxID=1516126 RepID=A0ABV9KTY7_9BACT